MKIDRLIAILLYLLSREKVTARELSSHFSVTMRTIYRDMETLDLAGVPIVSYQGVEGGYGLVESFKLDRTFFKEHEMLALFSALNGINTAINDTAIQSVLLKLSALGSKSAKAREKREELPPVLYVPIPWGMHQEWSERLDEIRGAVEHRWIIGFTYTKTDGETARRRVEPLTLVLQADVWYLYGWDIGKKDYRFFRLSRLSDLEVERNAHFVRKAGRRPYPWEAGWDSGPSTEIRLRFPASSAQKARDAFPWERPETGEDGSLLFKMKFPYGEWIESQILSFGADVEVLGPDCVRAKIREIALKTAAVNRPEKTYKS